MDGCDSFQGFFIAFQWMFVIRLTAIKEMVFGSRGINKFAYRLVGKWSLVGDTKLGCLEGQNYWNKKQLPEDKVSIHLQGI